MPKLALTAFLLSTAELFSALTGIARLTLYNFWNFPKNVETKLMRRLKLEITFPLMRMSSLGYFDQIVFSFVTAWQSRDNVTFHG